VVPAVARAIDAGLLLANLQRLSALRRLPRPVRDHLVPDLPAPTTVTNPHPPNPPPHPPPTPPPPPPPPWPRLPLPPPPPLPG